jgi:23S rRNA (uracil1939-C5)-methyltransferase
VTHPTQTLEDVRADGPDAETACLTLDRFGTLGDTAAEFEGREINVFGGIPGERVVCRIVRYRRRRKAVVSAIVTEVLEPSPHRVAPPCPYFGPCSGCQWQHIDYAHQLDLKREAVRQAVDEYDSLRGTEVGETMPSEEVLGYRNHARFTVRRSGSLGFVNRITRRFVKIDECLLMAAGINEILGKLQGRSGATSQLSIRYGTNSGDWLIQPRLSINEVGLEAGQSHYTERLLGRSFRIGSPSFFQVNTAQAERLIGLVKRRLRLSGQETVVDAYAGVGTFAVLLAEHAERMIAVEESDAAVEDARVNTAGIDNVEIVLGKVEDVIDELDISPDAVVLDPPRAGCQAQVLEAVARWRPGRVCYVSCDPSSLARDLDIMARSGFAVESIEPVDMFPQTYHVECVATLRPAA